MKKELLFILCVLLVVTWVACERKQESPKPSGWIRNNDFPGEKRANGIAFSIGGKGYVGLGRNELDIHFQDLWRYSPRNDSWERKADFPGKNPVISFAIGNKGYVLTYWSNFYEYDPAKDAWREKQPFTGGIRPNIAGFSIGNKGYVGTGNDNHHTLFRDFWEYDPTKDTWNRKTDFPGTARTLASGFSIGNKGYIGLGYDSLATPFRACRDLWEYNPLTDSWNERAAFPGVTNTSMYSFASTIRGYVVCAPAVDTARRGLVWEYDASQEQWRQLQDFPNQNYLQGQAFTIGKTCFVVGGFRVKFSNEVWEYNP